MKKDFIVRRTVTEVEGRPVVTTYSEEELTRCRDCRMSNVEKAFKHVPESKETVHWCKLISRYVDDDWFCADGLMLAKAAGEPDSLPPAVDQFGRRLCGNCYLPTITQADNYCPNCGRKVLWE